MPMPLMVHLPYGKLPAVHKPADQPAGSTKHALQHALDMMLKYEPLGVRAADLQVAIDDLETMIRCVE